jgi:hypothetical protein
MALYYLFIQDYAKKVYMALYLCLHLQLSRAMRAQKLYIFTKGRISQVLKYLWCAYFDVTYPCPPN